MNPRVPIYFELADLRDFLVYLDNRIARYRHCQDSGITAQQFDRYIRLRSIVIDVINTCF